VTTKNGALQVSLLKTYCACWAHARLDPDGKYGIARVTVRFGHAPVVEQVLFLERVFGGQP
jgi:hypothetical protein